MTTLTQLIEQYCPDGVDYVKLGDVAIRQRGIAITAAKMRELDSPDGDVVVFGAGATKALIDSSEIASTNIHTKDSVIVKARGHVGFEMCTVPFATKSEMWSYRSDDPRLNIKFGYYFLLEHSGELAELARLNGVKLPQLKVSDTDDYLIPLPPREVQDAIVERLDAFAALIESLDSEIVLRERRFEYFREQIFSTLDHDEPLGSHGTFLRGRGIQKKDFQDTGKPAFHYGQVHTKYGLSTSTTAALVSDEVFNRSAHANPGDLIIATTSEDDEAVGKSVVWLGQEQAAVGGDAHFFEHSYDPRFIGYFFTTHSFHDQKIPYLTGAKVRRINAKSLASIRAPWPPREVQKDIADKLDTMQALIDNLKQECELRRTQFEYYREKLLTFNS